MKKTKKQKKDCNNIKENKYPKFLQTLYPKKIIEIFVSPINKIVFKCDLL